MLTAKHRLLIPLFVLAVQTCWAGGSAPEARPLGREAFQDIRFSPACAKAQWSLTPEGGLEVIAAATPDNPCEVTLKPYSSLETGSRGAMLFEVRSLKTGQIVEAEVNGTDRKMAPAGAKTFRVDNLTTKWAACRVRLGRIKNVDSITFRAISNNPDNPIFIGDIRFIAGLAAGPGATAAARFASAAGILSSRRGAAAATTANALHRMIADPEIPAWAEEIPRKIKDWSYPLFLSALMMAVMGFARSMKKKRNLVNPVTPLYEMNTRTWGSSRDKEGVLHVGGFRAITFDDLKRIKDNGFNAVWFMGIWEIGQKVRLISKNYGKDYAGSPFAIADYAVSEELGSEVEFRELVDRAHLAGLSVIVDFVPNHMGLDSLWLNDHPEYFIHKVLEGEEANHTDEELIRKHPGYFPYRTPSYPVGEIRVPKTIMVAYGKDPYFFPWIDTAQLDYAHPGARRKMIEVLSHMAEIVDGVRCDMAMLVLREQVKIHRHPEMSWETFNRLMPHEFWTEAITAVKRINPHFAFIAETYWSLEGFIQRLGFDFTYNKPLYEAICGALHCGNAEGLANFLRMLGTGFLQRSVHFLENHDEERAMNSLGLERQRAAATILATLPGVILIHQGQMEGRRERLPVQRVVPLHKEQDNEDLKRHYLHLLGATRLPAFREGRLIVLHSNNPCLVSYSRMYGENKAIVVVNASKLRQTGSIFTTPGLRLESGQIYKLTDLFYPLKTQENRFRDGVHEVYLTPAAQVMNNGLYVELDPYDAHIFLIEPTRAFSLKDYMVAAIRSALPAGGQPHETAAAHISRSTETKV